MQTKVEVDAEKLHWDNEYININYLGISKEMNFWGVNFVLENKGAVPITVYAKHIVMNKFIVNMQDCVVYDLPAKEQSSCKLPIMFENLEDIDIYSLDEMNDIQLTFICQIDSKVIAESPRLELRITKYEEVQSDLIKITEIVKGIERGDVWKKPDAKWPRDISFEFTYPNGKHGDVDMHLISKYGNLEKIAPTSFKATISTEYLEIVELMVLFYYTRFSLNELRANRGDNKNAYDFLLAYNNIIKLYEVSSQAESKMEYSDIRSNPITQKAYHILHDYYEKIKEKRHEIYSNLIVEGKTSPRWKSEQQVYAIAKALYPDALYQYYSEWLGRQSLDVYIPSLKTGIEYQGIQHYEAIEHFGGKEGLAKRQLLDKKKKQLCIDNGVKLIEWKFDVIPTVENMKQMIIRSQK